MHICYLATDFLAVLAPPLQSAAQLVDRCCAAVSLIIQSLACRSLKAASSTQVGRSERHVPDLQQTLQMPAGQLAC